MTVEAVNEAGKRDDMSNSSSEARHPEGVRSFPPEIVEAQCVCALRFTGYEYEQVIGEQVADEMVNPMIESLRFHDRVEDNMLVFFRLQRFLYKWGGEQLTKYSNEHIAYDHLFLRLYREPVPVEFRHEKYFDWWEREFKDNAEDIAAYVRSTFRRVGEGPVCEFG